MDKSKRNKLAGKHSSYDEREMSDEQIDKKKNYDKKYAATDKRKRYRAMLNKINRRLGTEGDGKDVSHKKDGGYTLENQSANRARNRGKK